MKSGRQINFDQIDRIVIEGCGVRFPASIGCIANLEKRKRWQQINYIAASSGGVIPAFFAGLGMNSEEMLETAFAMNTSVFMEKSLVSRIPLIGAPLSKLSIFTHHGMSTANKVIAFAQSLLKEKGLSPSLTFRQHAQWRKENCELNPNIKNFIMTAVNNSTSAGDIIIFSADNKDTQDVEIAQAFAAALAYPSQIIPVKILINGKFVKCSDGGARDNYPYHVFPPVTWDKCLGFKLDCQEEIFRFHYMQPGLANIFFWNLVQDNHFIYGHFKNTIQMFDGNISVLDEVKPIDTYALYMSGEMAMSSVLDSKYDIAEEKKSVPIVPKIKSQVDIRTKKYQKLLEGGSSLTRFFSLTYLADLQRVFNEINAWDDEYRGCCVHYNALIDQINENQSSIASLFDLHLSGHALTLIRNNLLTLLRDRGAKSAFLPEATPDLINDILVAYLQINAYDKALHFFNEVLNNPIAKPKLMDINHRRVLEILNKSISSAKEKFTLIDLVESTYAELLKTHPYAYETYLTVKFGKLVTEKKYSDAKKILEKMKDVIPREKLQEIYEIALRQFDVDSEQGMQLRVMLLVKNEQEYKLVQQLADHAMAVAPFSDLQHEEDASMTFSLSM